MSNLYVWQVYEADQWGTIAAIVPAVAPTPIPLVTRNTAVANQWRALAHAHADASGLKVRLAAFQLDDVLEEYEGNPHEQSHTV